MNKLEQKFLDAMEREFRQYFSEEQAALCATIALELAENAFDEGLISGDANHTGKTFDLFKQEIL